MLEAPKSQASEPVEPLVEGMIEEVNDSDFEGFDNENDLMKTENANAKKPEGQLVEPGQGTREGDLVEIDLDPRMPH